MALDVGPGDEVILPTYTFFASAGTVARTGAKPVFVDCLPCCYNLDPKDVAAKITDKTKVIMPVHLFGQCAEMDPILAAAKEKGIHVIEDAAQALGAEYKGKRAGSMGDFGCFSFFPSKNLGGFGDAGLVTTNNPELAEKARIMRAHGGKPKYHHAIVGGNFRIDALQAALLNVKLAHLDTYSKRRQANAALYTEMLSSSGQAIVTPSHSEGADMPEAAMLLPATCQGRHIYNQFTLRLEDTWQRDALRQALSDRGIGTEIYYPVPMHHQKCFADLGYKRGDMPNAVAASEQTVAIPVFPELTRDEIEYVCDGIVAELVRQAA